MHNGSILGILRNDIFLKDSILLKNVPLKDIKSGLNDVTSPIYNQNYLQRM